VTNALRHAGGDEDGPIELRAWAPGPCIRVEVCDRGTGFDPQEVEAEAGFGLRLVSVYASRWGVAREDDRTAVWFEIDRRHS
jgi:anti-sigma regulatory factor (Ser/Thr protein kinase)